MHASVLRVMCLSKSSWAYAQEVHAGCQPGSLCAAKVWVWAIWQPSATSEHGRKHSSVVVYHSTWGQRIKQAPFTHLHGCSLPSRAQTLSKLADQKLSMLAQHTRMNMCAFAHPPEAVCATRQLDAHLTRVQAHLTRFRRGSMLVLKVTPAASSMKLSYPRTLMVQLSSSHTEHRRRRTQTSVNPGCKFKPLPLHRAVAKTLTWRRA